VRVLSERIADVRSCSLGVWVGTGSRHEPERLGGAAHFIEHMLFKGTETRSAQDLAAFMDSVGGQINAFTTRELTCFHGRVVDEKVSALAEVLADILLRSKFAESDVAAERNVILEEIGMYEDTPDDVATELLTAKVFHGSLGRPILGTAGKLNRMTGATLRKYQKSRYVGSAIVVAMCGSFSDGDLARVCELFGEVEAGDAPTFEPTEYTPAVASRRKPIEQNHIVLAMPGIQVTDERRYALQLMSDILGGGMSSRLFQQVRETRGLCYSVYSYASSYADTGSLSIYTALGADTERDALRVIADEVRKFRDGGVTSDELTRSRDQVRANLLMSLESTSSRMNRLGRNTLTYGHVIDTEDSIARYEAVTADDIAAVAGELLDFSKLSLSVVGKVRRTSEYLEILKK
jgi:predicted Zn-dependent peptidase